MENDQDPTLSTRLRHAVAQMAPTLASALGGPLAGAAVQALSRAVIGQEASGAAAEHQLEAALIAQDPQTLAAVRRAELEFREAVLSAQVEQTRLANADRADARARQIATRDLTPTLLGVAVIGGFFSVLGLMVLRDLPPQAETEFSIMLGALATMTAAVVNYFFGSSAGSREKTKIMVGHRP